MNRLLVVSNRLPGTIVNEHDRLVMKPSSGGLVTAMKPLLQNTTQESMWVGWPGSTEREGLEEALRSQKSDTLKMLPIFLEQEDIVHYYDGYSNSVLWPVFHNMPLLAKKYQKNLSFWSYYEQVNIRFANQIAKVSDETDTVWIHDYHLMRVGHFLKAYYNIVNTGFFLHIPFPKLNNFLALQNHKEILEGLLSHKVIGFHTNEYRENFVKAVQYVFPNVLFNQSNQLIYRGREITVGVYPISIDAEAFMNESRNIRTKKQPKRTILHVSRLDYTKGHDKELQAFELLLTRHPELVGSLQLTQIVVPSREGVLEYQKYKDKILSLARRINNKFGNVVEQRFTSLSKDELLTLYKQADILDVPSLADGMNLVAKEYSVAGPEDGVMLLSKFAGASEELKGAILFNPKNVTEYAQFLYLALQLNAQERKALFHVNKQAVLKNTVYTWAEKYMGDFQPDRLNMRSNSFNENSIFTGRP